MLSFYRYRPAHVCTRSCPTFATPTRLLYAGSHFTPRLPRSARARAPLYFTHAHTLVAHTTRFLAHRTFPHIYVPHLYGHTTPHFARTGWLRSFCRAFTRFYTRSRSPHFARTARFTHTRAHLHTARSRFWFTAHRVPHTHTGSTPRIWFPPFTRFATRFVLRVHTFTPRVLTRAHVLRAFSRFAFAARFRTRAPLPLFTFTAPLPYTPHHLRSDLPSHPHVHLRPVAAPPHTFAGLRLVHFAFTFTRFAFCRVCDAARTFTRFAHLFAHTFAHAFARTVYAFARVHAPRVFARLHAHAHAHFGCTHAHHAHVCVCARTRSAHAHTHAPAHPICHHRHCPTGCARRAHAHLFAHAFVCTFYVCAFLLRILPVARVFTHCVRLVRLHVLRLHCTHARFTRSFTFAFVAAAPLPRHVPFRAALCVHAHAHVFTAHAPFAHARARARFCLRSFCA